MQRYLNLSGDSGVAAFELRPDAIVVRFHDGGTYLYTRRSAGSDVLDTMHRLAEAGQGLATFINRVVRDGYASRLD